MKAKLKFLMLALAAVFACVSFTSCSDDEDVVEKGIGDYYFQLTGVESNCTDANGKSIIDAFKADWISANKADSNGKMAIGKTDRETAEKWFDNNISSMIDGYSKSYKGKLPEGGYIRLSFYLGVTPSYGYAGKWATIEITNSGARQYTGY